MCHDAAMNWNLNESMHFTEHLSTHDTNKHATYACQPLRQQKGSVQRPSEIMFVTLSHSNSRDSPEDTVASRLRSRDDHVTSRQW